MVKQRSLADLLRGTPAQTLGDAGMPVTGVAYDSRRVQSGEVFVAIPGYRVDGTAYAADARRAGAAAIVAEQAPTSDQTCRPWVIVPSARRALAALACEWFEHPSRDLEVLGITGTNGKTTVTALLEQLLATRGGCGRWSTTLVRWPGHSFPTPRTTPEALELQQSLRGMAEAGCWAAAIEVSSHALSLHRVDGTRFAAATFTNLSPDHLDFHRDMDAYLDAKAMLFERLSSSAPGLINAGDPRAEALVRRCAGRALRYGWQAERGGLDYVATLQASSPSGSELLLRGPAVSLTLRTPLFGKAMCENVIAAVATALALGVEPSAIVNVVAAFRGEPGRLESVDAGQEYRVLVDFAHTPAALQAAMDAARAIADGRLIVVFGCGGDRDRGKRPQMGSIAAAGGDRVIVTSDNPRSEDPDGIIAEILAGIPAARREAVEVLPDRSLAIDTAIAGARPGDCVLIAGKGHESMQLFADHNVPFDDRLVAAGAIRRHATPGVAQ